MYKYIRGQKLHISRGKFVSFLCLYIILSTFGAEQL